MKRFAAVGVGLYAGLIGLIAFLVSFNWPPHVIIFHLLVSVLMVGGYVWLVAGGMKQNEADERDFLPGESLSRRTRRHGVVVVPGIVIGMIGLVVSALAFEAWNSNDKLTVPVPSFGKQPLPQPSQSSPVLLRPAHIASHHHSFVVWYIPAIIAVVLLLTAITWIENWRCSWWDLTDRRLIARREMSPLIPLLVRRSVDASQLNQVVDVDYQAGLFASKFNWGTIPLKMRIQGLVITNDSEIEKTLTFVPDPRGFAGIIRRASPYTNPSIHQPGLNPGPPNLSQI